MSDLLNPLNIFSPLNPFTFLLLFFLIMTLWACYIELKKKHGVEKA